MIVIIDLFDRKVIGLKAGTTIEEGIQTWDIKR